MTGRLSDLNDHLFAQLDRLARTDMSPDDIDREVQRTEAIVAVSEQVVENAKVQLTAAKLFAEHGNTILPHLPLVGSSSAPSVAPAPPVRQIGRSRS